MFSVLEGATIVSAVENAMQDKLENLLLGKPVTDEPLFADGDLSAVEEAFRRSIDERAYDARLPGVPTRAAERGVNHRLARPYAKGNPPRPSFLDTGLLQNNMRVWVTE